MKKEMVMKDEVKALWKTCFDDSDEFVNLYFTMRYNDELNRAIVADGRLVSALQAVPYPMTYGGRLLNTAYISGACTHPDFREQGAMRQLLKEAHRRMYEDGIYLSTLIPAEDWLKGYYAKSGYASCFYYGQTTVSLSGLNSFDARCNVEVYEKGAMETFAYFEDRMRLRPNCVQHTLEDYSVILADLYLTGGLVLVARQGGDICGLAFCVEENTVPVVKEMLCDTVVAKEMLWRQIRSIYGISRLEWIHPADASSSLPLGMARIVSVKGMLSLYAEAHPEDSFHIYVNGDEAIPENNGSYTLEQGQCVKELSPGKKGATYTIAGLTRKLFSTERPFMSLMLN